MKPGQLNGVFIIAAVNLGIAMKNDKAKATQIRVKLLTRFMHSNEPVIERRKREKITRSIFEKLSIASGVNSRNRQINNDDVRSLDSSKS